MKPKDSLPCNRYSLTYIHLILFFDDQFWKRKKYRWMDYIINFTIVLVMFFFHKVEVDCNFCDMQLSEGYIKTVNDSRNPQRTLVQNPVLFKNQVTIVVNQTSIPTSQTPDCLWCFLFVSRFNISWFQSKSPSKKQCQMEYPDLGVFMCPICMQLWLLLITQKRLW